jgi:hypothetical protein
MALDPTPPGQPEVEAANTQASILMKEGIRLMGDAQPQSVREALAFFERALEIRRRLPMETVPLLRYGLAACWLNRADALMQLGGEAQVEEALRSYQEGIVLLRSLPLSHDARFPRRLAMAHHNRGLALQSKGAPFAAETANAFREALAILESEQAALIPDRQFLLATVWLNLANARELQEPAGSDSTARDAALRAIDLVKDLEEDEADAAEVGLKARHVLCRTLAAQMSLSSTGRQKVPEYVHEATDLVDEGLALVRHWERKDVARFRSVAYDLFRFGARVYGRYQPQFVGEFVLDNLDPRKSSSQFVESAEMRSAVLEALRL